jgi:signal peptidase I
MLAGRAEDKRRMRPLRLNVTFVCLLALLAVCPALSGETTSRRQSGTVSPSSTLDWDSALRVATAARFMVTGSEVLTVMPTGSMEPAFNERAILVTEPAEFQDLKVGDIVAFKHPKFEDVVVHRILEKRGDKFWSKGDNNGRMDEVYITRENYVARVFCIIYAREGSALARNYPMGVAAR